MQVVASCESVTIANREHLMRHRTLWRAMEYSLLLPLSFHVRTRDCIVHLNVCADAKQ